MKALLLPALAGTLLLAGCSGFTPIYGERGLTAERLPLAYSEPASRLDQIVIQELALRLGRADGPGSALVTITSTSTGAELTRTEIASPREEQQVTVRVSYTLVAGDRILGSGTRTATAGYATVGQVLADDAAAADAAERAARAAAETIRLSILGDLATPAAVPAQQP